jgi:hypothetical protein
MPVHSSSWKCGPPQSGWKVEGKVTLVGDVRQDELVPIVGRMGTPRKLLGQLLNNVAATDGWYLITHIMARRKASQALRAQTAGSTRCQEGIQMTRFSVAYALWTKAFSSRTEQVIH